MNASDDEFLTVFSETYFAMGRRRHAAVSAVAFSMITPHNNSHLDLENGYCKVSYKCEVSSPVSKTLPWLFYFCCGVAVTAVTILYHAQYGSMGYCRNCSWTCYLSWNRPAAILTSCKFYYCSEMVYQLCPVTAARHFPQLEHLGRLLTGIDIIQEREVREWMWRIYFGSCGSNGRCSHQSLHDVKWIILVY